MENLQNQNASSTGTTPTSIIAPASNTNPTSTTVVSTTENKGKQLQVFASRKRNVDDKKKSQIWDHFTKLDGDPTTPRAECNYCGKDYTCHTIIKGISNMWSHLKVCKKFPFMVDKKQNFLVLEPNKVGDELGDRSVGTLKAIGYDYDECRKTLVKMVKLMSCLLILWRVRDLDYFLGPCSLDLTFLLVSLL